MLDIVTIPALGDNYIYLLQDRATQSVAVVDPGDAAPVVAALDARNWSLNTILLTHHHGDHVAGAPSLKARYGSTIIGSAGDAGRLSFLDQAVRAGDRVSIGEATAEVIETPGHTRGHIAFWFADSDTLFCGDTLFSLGCGRLFEGTAGDMWTSLKKLRDLPDRAQVYCGHEYTFSNARFALSIDPDNAALGQAAREIASKHDRGDATIPANLGSEKTINPFLRADDPAMAAAVAAPPGADPVAVFAEIRKRKDAF